MANSMTQACSGVFSRHGFPPRSLSLPNSRRHSTFVFSPFWNRNSLAIHTSKTSQRFSNGCGTARRSPSSLPRGSAIRAGLEQVLGDVSGIVVDSFTRYPPSWSSSLIVTSAVFVLGSPVLLSGLTWLGVASAFVLGLLSWRAFGFFGFLIVSIYFVLGTAVTKVRLKQKESEGIAEKRKGRRGPGSVIGSGTAGVLCALAAISPLGQDPATFQLFQLGFIASFCSKLSDTSASEIGKAFGSTTYLATTFAKVPRGTEGAVSLEGTLAGLLASCFLASVAVINNQIDPFEASICVFSSQIANYGESVLGATLQDKEGFQWLTNDLVNVLNITLGASLAMAFKLLL